MPSMGQSLQQEKGMLVQELDAAGVNEGLKDRTIRKSRARVAMILGVNNARQTGLDRLIRVQIGGDSNVED